MGNMQNISFGRIFKVNVPASVAERVVDAKKYRRPFKNSQLLGRFENIHVVQPNDKDIYIFTGKDGEAYWESYSDAYDTMESAHERYGGDDLFDIETDWAWKEHADWTNGYIEANKSKIKNLNVSYEEQQNWPFRTIINSIDIQA